jgi:adenylylsulfate kinase-like enzyme
MLEKKLYRLEHHNYLLYGDNVRLGLNIELGFTNEDTAENMPRHCLNDYAV